MLSLVSFAFAVDERRYYLPPSPPLQSYPENDVKKEEKAEEKKEESKEYIGKIGRFKIYKNEKG